MYVYVKYICHIRNIYIVITIIEKKIIKNQCLCGIKNGNRTEPGEGVHMQKENRVAKRRCLKNPIRPPS
jgi:hypothetical protein